MNIWLFAINHNRNSINMIDLSLIRKKERKKERKGNAKQKERKKERKKER